MSENLETLAKKVQSSLKSRECSFVEPFPSEVQTECSICLQVLKEPYVVGCCGYRFCKSCLGVLTKFCPLCKAFNFDKLPDKQLERLISQRAVYCLLKDSGCEWRGELCNLSAHLSLGNSSIDSACEFVPVPCPYCKVYYRRKDLSGHQGNCESRPSNCMYCNQSCTHRDLPAHYEVCPNFPRHCKNKCSDECFTKEAMESHIANDCPLEMIACEYRFAGCSMRFLRKNVDEHMKERADLHLRHMKTKYKQLQDKELKASSALQPLREENKKLKEENKELHVMILELSTKFDELALQNKELKKASKGKEIQRLKVTNLPSGVNKHNLKSVFGQFGTVSDIELNKPHNKAFITYSSQSEYNEALQAGSTRGINLLKHKLGLEPIYS